VILVALNCHTEEMMKGAKVLHGKLVLECCNQAMQELLGGGSEDDLVDIEKQVDCLGATTKYEEGCIGLCFTETQRKQEGGKPTLPCPWSLF